MICSQQDREQAQTLSASEDRAAWLKAHGPIPAVLEMRIKSTGRIVRHSIPRHMQKRKVRGRRSRRAV